MESDFLGREYSIDTYKRLLQCDLETPDIVVMTLHGMNQAFSTQQFRWNVF